MTSFALAVLLLILSTITYCLYRDIYWFKMRKKYLLEQDSISDKIKQISDNVYKACIIKQKWEDYYTITPFSGTGWASGYYCIAVLFTLATIVAYAIMRYKTEEKLLSLILIIGQPIVLSVIIWIVFLSLARKHYKHLYLDSVSDLKRSLEKEAINFEDLDKKTQAIFENELWIKEKANRYYAALEVVLLLSIITLVSQFI